MDKTKSDPNQGFSIVKIVWVVANETKLKENKIKSLSDLVSFAGY